MPDFIIAPARLKLVPGTPIPEHVSLTFIASGPTPLCEYHVSLYGKTLWSADSDREGRLSLDAQFAPGRAGSFQFEISKIHNARQGFDAESNRAFLIEYVEPKPSRWRKMIADRAKLARQQLARLIARGDA